MQTGGNKILCDAAVLTRYFAGGVLSKIREHQEVDLSISKFALIRQRGTPSQNLYMSPKVRRL